MIMMHNEKYHGASFQKDHPSFTRIKVRIMVIVSIKKSSTPSIMNTNFSSR
jgi:hypothetical protein